MDYSKLAMQKHKELKGKISLALNDTLDSVEKLSTYYTPGVAAVSTHLAEHPEETRDYTWTHNTVAVVSDGSAVLGLGDIGPYGAMPVMEGKAMLFKHFANINAVPIILDVHGVDEIVAAVRAIAPSFGGINLEDISAPKCFEIENQLKGELDIPVFHDDQHGTAIVVLAGLINAMKLTGKQLHECRIVVVGAGAAGTAIMKLLYRYARPMILAVDSQGIVSRDRYGLTLEKRALLEYTNSQSITGELSDAMKDADIFIGVSQGGLLNQKLVKSMAKDPIIFAMANPTPEIMPVEAMQAGARIVATGRSDFPNQINNVLAFPGVFRGALDNRLTKITDTHKIAAAEALAALVETPTASKIIPEPFDPRVVKAVAQAVC